MRARPYSWCLSPLTKALAWHIQSLPRFSCLIQWRESRTLNKSNKSLQCSSSKRMSLKIHISVFILYFCSRMTLNDESLLCFFAKWYKIPLVLLCVLPSCLTITRAADFWHQATLLSSTFLCFGALAAVLLSTLQYGFSQFVVLPQSQSGVHTSMHTHTHTHTNAQPNTQVNPTAGLLCHTGGCCVIGWICSPARNRDSPLKFHFTSGSVNKPWDYWGCKSTFYLLFFSHPPPFLFVGHVLLRVYCCAGCLLSIWRGFLCVSLWLVTC